MDAEFLGTITPLLKDTVIRSISSKIFEEISTKKGKEKLSNEIKESLNKRMGANIIKNVFYNKFFIQTQPSTDDIIKRIREIEDRCFGN
jgi:flagellar basal body-associated protein FliL